ncbi:MAG: AMIN domain-containing protein [Proteobacteria bacterium]|nr:AMIN domain-containing protein [Pseudomonadota bacterium]
MHRSLVVVALFLVPTLNCSAADIEGVRMWQSAAETSVVFDLSEPLSYRLSTLENPNRLVVDFAQTEASGKLALPAVSGTPVAGLRYALRANGDLRVVLDLTEKLSTHDLLLPALEKYGDRLLLKLTPRHRLDRALPSSPAAQARNQLASSQETVDRPIVDLKPVDSFHVAGPRRPTLIEKAGSLVDRLMGSAGDDASWVVSGFYSAEARAFIHDAQYPRQHEANASFAIQPEFYLEWDNGSQSFLVVPFARWDQGDPRRTHVDLREFSYINSATNWELRAGVRKVFWGVAESNHLVDIINQFDVVENIDNEDKLGQPMINVAYIQDWGTIDVFALIGFRERTFPGVKGRLRPAVRIDPSSTTYDSAAENSHVDWAVRYAHSIGIFDVGLYHFWGTSREPRFFPKLTSSRELVLAPHYDIINQTGTDVQATAGNWLFKFEGLRRSGQGESFIATVGGFEYTFVGLGETAMDLGVLSEYHFDNRGKDARTPFNNDLFGGARLAFNDVQDTAVLAGMAADIDGRSKFFNVEASRRIGANWKLEAEMRVFWDVATSDPFYGIRRDDYVQIELARYF